MKSSSWPGRLLPLLVVLGFIALWFALCSLKVATDKPPGWRYLFPDSLFPTPQSVWEAFGEEIRFGRMTKNIVASLFRVISGFLLAVVLGIPFGLWLGHSRPARLALLPAINFFRNLSPLAWIGFSILWFGIGHKSAIFLIFLASFFPLALATVAAVSNIPSVYFRVAQDYGFRGLGLLWHVTLPAILPQLITALRVTAGLAWVVVVAAEMTGAQEGLGYAVYDARNALRPDLLVVAMIVIGAIGVCLDWLLVQLTRIPSVRWGYER
jgi:NitT/TauT family transport system permease protein